MEYVIGWTVFLGKVVKGSECLGNMNASVILNSGYVSYKVVTVNFIVITDTNHYHEGQSKTMTAMI